MKTPINILILEHDPNDIGLLQYELKKSGLDHTSQIVQTQQDYEQAIHSFRPDIILSDFSLPSFDGLSAFRLKQSIAPETPFILISGTIGEENAVELIKMGVTDYVLKGNLYQVFPKIQRALNEAAERKQKETAELQRRQSEEQLQKILDLSLDLICTIDADGVFVTVNAASTDVLGYTPDELIGSRAIDFVHDDDKDRTYWAMMDFMAGKAMINFENRYLRKNGEPVTLLWSSRWDNVEKIAYSVARDATAIKQAEETIRNNERRFRTLLQNSKDGLSLLAADGTIIERSPAATKILGLDPEEVYGTFRTERVHPDDLPILQEACAHAKDNPGKIFTIEFRLLGPDDDYKWIETTLNNQLLEPSVGAIVLNFNEITERKKAEIALRESEAKLKEAQAIGHIGNWELDWSGEKTMWSDEVYKIFGVNKYETEPTFEAFQSFIHPDDRSTVLSKFERATAAMRDGTLDFRIKNYRGETRYVVAEWRVKFDINRKPLKLFGVIQDVTERKLIEIALERSQEKYRDLFNLSPIPMWLFDTDTLCFLDVNEAAVRHYGYSREEFLSMTLKDIRPKEEIKKLEKVRSSFEGSNAYYHDIAKHKKRNGEVIDVDIKNSALEVDGKHVRLVLATDISDRIKYTQAIEEQNIKLRDIAWMQSHVVRAPLARMMGLVSLLNKPSDTGCPSEILSYLQSSAHELDDIIRSIVKKTEQVNDRFLIEEKP